MPRVRRQPCEGYCNTTWASCRRVALRATPSPRAAVVGNVDSGQLVRVLDGQRHTTTAGRVVVQHTHTLVQRLSGSDGDVPLTNPKRWRLRRGDTIHVVDKDTDGDSYVNYVWILRGHEDTTAAFWDDPAGAPARPARVRMIAELEQTWWVRVRNATGLAGWTTQGPEWSGTSYYDEPASRCARGSPAG
ncbi:MAG TPA: hypothetical protein VKA54_01275 [Gemmatimonadaceae bacterium]|nr:hypothetical protein [Gemmatimonadaceae bacterium]